MSPVVMTEELDIESKVMSRLSKGSCLVLEDRLDPKNGQPSNLKVVAFFFRRCELLLVFRKGKTVVPLGVHRSRFSGFCFIYNES